MYQSVICWRMASIDINSVQINLSTSSWGLEVYQICTASGAMPARGAPDTPRD